MGPCRVGACLAIAALGGLGLSASASSGPSVTILHPAKGSTVSRLVPWVAASSGADASRVDFLVDGRLLWTGHGAPLRFGGQHGRWNSRTVPNGRHRLTVRIPRGGAPALVASAVVRVANRRGLAILAPDNGATVTGALAWTAHVLGSPKRVDFLVDGKRQWVAKRAPWRFGGAKGMWNSASVANGTHTLTVATLSATNTVRTTRVRVRVANHTRGGGSGTTGGGGGSKKGGGGTTTTPPPTSAGGATPGSSATPSLPAGTGFFSPTSIWNAPVSSGAALDPNSDAMVNELVRQVSEITPWINTDAYSTPFYTVPSDMRKINVQLTRSDQNASVVRAFTGVPMPPNARPADGEDHHLVVWQPASDTMWEFIGLQGSGDSWSADWGGKITNVSTSSGVDALPTGATASGLALAGGVVTLSDWRSGVINHALAMAIPEPRAQYLAAPANRTDGWKYGDQYIPEGAHFRLDPNLNIDSLNLPPATKMLAVAAQKYGIVVRDKSGAVVFYGEDPTPTGGDPYPSIFGGMSPSQVMAAFPWSHLELLRMTVYCCWQHG
jgi:hypothetical protein